MEITFFNLCSIGDIFFTIPFLKHICKHNPSMNFFFFTRFASALQQGIPNLIPVDKEFHPIDHPHNQNLYLFFHQFDRQLYVFLEPTRLLINTWVHPMNQKIAPLDAECVPEHLAIAYQQLLKEVNGSLPFQLEFPLPTNKELLFEMPPLDLPLWEAFPKQQTLFYWNRLGASADTKPFSIEQDHFTILTKLSALFPTYTIIVPNEAILPPCPNIICTSRFGVKEDHTCQNVLEDITIAGQCTYAIVFDVGSAFSFCNTQFGSYSARFLHLSKKDMFYTRLKKALQDGLEISCENYRFIQCETPEQVVRSLQDAIPSLEEVIV